jgi:hypothetical protein
MKPTAAALHKQTDYNGLILVRNQQTATKCRGPMPRNAVKVPSFYVNFSGSKRNFVVTFVENWR